MHRALEVWGRARIEHRRAGPGSGAAEISYREAFEIARGEFDDVTNLDATRALASGERAIEALARYQPLAVEEPFELEVGKTLVNGAVDLIARDPEGTIVVIDYKTGTAAGEAYALQLALYGRIAVWRYPGEGVVTAILRLTPERASFEYGSSLTKPDIDERVAGAGQLTSDEPRVGEWCRSCAYYGSPCLAPLEAG